MCGERQPVSGNAGEHSPFPTFPFPTVPFLSYLSPSYRAPPSLSYSSFPFAHYLSLPFSTPSFPFLRPCSVHVSRPPQKQRVVQALPLYVTPLSPPLPPPTGTRTRLAAGESHAFLLPLKTACLHMFRLAFGTLARLPECSHTTAILSQNRVLWASSLRLLPSL
jgi:hypothetical protein